MNHTDPTAAIYEALTGLQGGPHHLPPGTRQAIAEHLAAALPAVSAVVSPPTSRADARDRIAEALHQDQTPPPTVPWSDEAPMDREFFLRRADAVLAVLPEPTSRAAVLLDAADRMSRKAAKLTNGLDDLAIFVGKARAAEAEILNREADVLRRLAAEAQQQHGTEAHPPLHAWRVETRDGEWAPGSHFLNRQAAVERYETANRTAPLWQDGTPVERRIVRETTTYTVEEPASEQQPAAADAP